MRIRGEGFRAARGLQGAGAAADRQRRASSPTVSLEERYDGLLGAITSSHSNTSTLTY